MMTDMDRQEFLRQLDNADFEVSDWEARFIESCLNRTQYTEAQREVIDRLIERYERRLS